MRTNEQEPLVAIARAQHRVREGMLPQFGLSIGGEFSRALASGLEFREELVLSPPARGHQVLGAFHANRATRDPFHKLVVAHDDTGRIGSSLQRLPDVGDDHPFDYDDVLEAFGDGPAIWSGLVLELGGREHTHSANQALARLCEVGCCAFTFGWCYGTLRFVNSR
jgi:hypothetical protein